MPKGVPNKRRTPAFKQQIAETMQKERLGCRETARRFEIGDHHRIRDWERIYLTEGPEGFAGEQRGRGGKGRKQLPKEAEVQRLRAEADYLKNCKPWFWKTSDADTKNAGGSGAEAKTFSPYSSSNRSAAPRNLLPPFETDGSRG